jgi:hypothetical protein
VAFELLRTVTVKFSVFWDVIPCSLVERINISEEPTVYAEDGHSTLLRNLGKYEYLTNYISLVPMDVILHVHASYAIIRLTKFDVALKPFCNNIQYVQYKVQI